MSTAVRSRVEKTKIPRRKLARGREGKELKRLLLERVRSPPRVEGGGDRGATPRCLNRYSKPQGENARLRQGLSRLSFCAFASDHWHGLRVGEGEEREGRRLNARK